MPWARSARFAAVEAGAMASADASSHRWRGGDLLHARAGEERPPGGDQVCSHCGFARDVHATHCPVFAAAMNAGAQWQDASDVSGRRRADDCTRALPAEEVPPSNDDLALERTRGDPARPRLTTPRPKVLVADDHPVHRQWNRVIFEALACSVDVAEDGAAALARCAVEAFDLVLIDRHMPVVGGDEAVHRLRAGQGPSSRAYVAVCSSDPPSDPAAGYDAVATKPLDVDTACALLTEALSAAASRARQT